MNDLIPATVTLPSVGEPQSIYAYAALVRDLAVALQGEEDILAAHGLSPDDFTALKSNEFFTKLLDSARKEWQSVANTVERTTIEAAFTFEQLLPALHSRAVDPETPFSQMIEYAKLLAKAGGIGEGRTSGSAADKFSIVINMGGDTKLEVTPPRRPSNVFALDPSEIQEVQDVVQQ
jgi:hypothetical protein